MSNNLDRDQTRFVRPDCKNYQQIIPAGKRMYKITQNGFSCDFVKLFLCPLNLFSCQALNLFSCQSASIIVLSLNNNNKIYNSKINLDLILSKIITNKVPLKFAADDKLIFLCIFKKPLG